MSGVHISCMHCVNCRYSIKKYCHTCKPWCIPPSHPSQAPAVHALLYLLQPAVGGQDQHQSHQASLPLLMMLQMLSLQACCHLLHVFAQLAPTVYNICTPHLPLQWLRLERLGCVGGLQHAVHLGSLCCAAVSAGQLLGGQSEPCLHDTSSNIQ